MKAFFIRWMTTVIAVLVASHLIPGIDYQGWGSLLVASLLLGFLNAVFKPLLMLLSLPLLLLSFGLFTVIINSFLLLLVGKWVSGFEVAGFGSAFWGSLVISTVTVLMKVFQKDTVQVRVGSKRSSGRSSKDRVIDV